MVVFNALVTSLLDRNVIINIFYFMFKTMLHVRLYRNPVESVHPSVSKL